MRVSQNANSDNLPQSTMNQAQIYLGKSIYFTVNGLIQFYIALCSLLTCSLIGDRFGLQSLLGMKCSVKAIRNRFHARSDLKEISMHKHTNYLVVHLHRLPTELNYLMEIPTSELLEPDYLLPLVTGHFFRTSFAVVHMVQIQIELDFDFISSSKFKAD